MKTKAISTLMSAFLAVLAATFWLAPAAVAGSGAPRIAPPQSHAYGKTLTEWLSIYWRWNYSGADPAQSFIGQVKLLPLPVSEYIDGDGTPDSPAVLRGQLAITLRPGTPFVLPLSLWGAERYNDGRPDDPMFSDAEFLAGVSPTLTIDGRLVVSDANAAVFYVGPTAFDPIVTYPAPTSYNSYALLAFQGHGIVSPPLPVGTHVIHMYESYIIWTAPYFIAQIYDNTWIVTVTPH
jgi:hypothetical protein